MLPSTRPHNHPGEHKCSSSRSHELSTFPLLPCAPTNCTLSPGMLRNFLPLLCLLNCKEARRKVHSRVSAVQSLVKKNKSLPGLAAAAIWSGTVGVWTRTRIQTGFSWLQLVTKGKREPGSWSSNLHPLAAHSHLHEKQTLNTVGFWYQAINITFTQLQVLCFAVSPSKHLLFPIDAKWINCIQQPMNK